MFEPRASSSAASASHPTAAFASELTHGDLNQPNLNRTAPPPPPPPPSQPQASPATSHFISLGAPNPLISLLGIGSACMGAAPATTTADAAIGDRSGGSGSGSGGSDRGGGGGSSCSGDGGRARSCSPPQLSPAGVGADAASAHAAREADLAHFVSALPAENAAIAPFTFGQPPAWLVSAAGLSLNTAAWAEPEPTTQARAHDPSVGSLLALVGSWLP